MSRKTKSLTIDAFLLALLIICSQVTIPLPLVPLTLQTLVIGLIASLVSVSASLEIITIYILLGVIGLPVFADMSGGIVVILSPLGGYIIGFLLYAVCCAGVITKVKNTPLNIALANCLGAFSQLLLGTIWLMYFAHMTFLAAIESGMLPFIFPGIIKIILVVMIVRRIKHAIKI